MGYSRANALNPTRQAAITAPATKEKVERYKPKQGMNILLVVPSLSETSPLPYRHLHVHYNPFHMCLRPDPFEDAEGTVSIDKRYGPCPRCQNSWDLLEKEGFKGVDYEKMPDGPDKERLGFLRGQRATHQMLWQVLDMTAFFTIKEVRKAYKVELNPDMVKHLDAFAKVIAGEADVSTIPEELHEAAKFGVSRISVNKTAGLRMRDAYYDRYMALNESDPLVVMDGPSLMKISLAPSDKKMKVGNQERVVLEWNVSFTTDVEVKGLNISKLSNAIEKVAIDLYSEKPAEETMAAYNDAFAKPPSKEVLLKWLADAEWNLGGTASEDESEDEAPQNLGFEPPKGYNPGGALDRYQNRAADVSPVVSEDDIPF